MFRLKAAVLSLIMPAVVGVIFFASAGRWDLPVVWALLGVLAVFSMSMAASADPGMVRERVKPGPGNRDRLTRPDRRRDAVRALDSRGIGCRSVPVEPRAVGCADRRGDRLRRRDGVPVLGGVHEPVLLDRRPCSDGSRTIAWWRRGRTVSSATPATLPP